MVLNIKHNVAKNGQTSCLFSQGRRPTLAYYFDECLRGKLPVVPSVYMEVAGVVYLTEQSFAVKCWNCSF